MPSPQEDANVPDAPGGSETASAALENNVVGDRALLESRYDAAQQAFAAASDDAMHKFLAPFAETFAALHSVTLSDVPTGQAVPELDQVDVEVREKATMAIQILVAAGGNAGVVHAAVSLGIRALSGSPVLVKAATRSLPSNLTSGLADYVNRGVTYTSTTAPKIAAQGKELFVRAGSNLGKHKSPVILLGISALAVGAIAWGVSADQAAKEAELAQERQKRLDADAAHRAQLLDDLNQDRLRFSTERTDEATRVLTQLTDIGLSRLPVLRDLTARNDDYATYTHAERLIVAELAGLVETTAAVIASQQATPTPQATRDGQDSEATLRAARHVTRRYTPRLTPGSVAAPAAAVAWTTASYSTTSQREQLVHLLGQRSYIERLAERCTNVHQRVREGFLFEFIHELSFNLDAIGKHSDVRATMTERLGRPHDAVDIDVTISNRDTVGRVQAKVVESKYSRVGVRNGLADAKYAGMDRLIPADHVQPTHEYLDRVLARPDENIYTPAYKDAKQHITDTITSGDISSDPITTADLTQIANDPDSYLSRLVQTNRRDQAVVAGLAGGGTAAVTALATDITHELISEGRLDGLNWAQAAIAAARTGVASAVATAAGNYLQTGAVVAAENGTGGALGESVAHGDHGVALTQATVGIAAIAHGLATDRLTPAQAAIAAGETITQSSLIWASTAIARKTIADPETAAIIGGVVGQVGAQLISQGIQIAVLGRDPDAAWDTAYEALLADTATLERAYADERHELAELSDRYRARFAKQVQPALERLNTNTDPEMGSAPEAALADLVAIADHFDGAPLFGTLDAFDDFMEDPTTVLVLDLGRI